MQKIIQSKSLPTESMASTLLVAHQDYKAKHENHAIELGVFS